MRNSILLAVVVAVAGCAASTQTAPTTATPGTPNRFADRAECDRLVDHMVAIVEMDQEHPRGNLFAANDQTPEAHRTMVDKCTISVNRAGYECLMRAHDRYQADECYKVGNVTAD